MDGVLEWGLEVVRAVQTAESPALTLVMKGVSLLGSEFGYFALLPLLYWCFDERRGFKLAVAALFSAWLNHALKAVWKQPRPYDLDPSVGMAYEPTNGLPSGHAQGMLVLSGIVGSWLRRPLGLALAIVLPLAVSFSRVYLGVHFPTDIFGGWILGGIVLAFYFLAGPRLEAALAAAGIRIKLIAVVVVAFAMNALHPQDVSFGGVFLGMGAGYVLMSARFPFAASRGADGASASLLVRAIRYALGLAVAGALYAGLKAAFPGSESESYRLFRFVRYGLVGLWVSAGAPYVFLRLRLAGGR